MRKLVALLLLLSLGAGLGLSAALVAPEPDAGQTIEWLDNPRGLSRFSLETETGQFDNQALMGQWTIVVFGFLNCPDFCPTSLSQLASVADGLAAKSVDQEVRYVFVSVDPERDSVAEIRRYVSHFGGSIQGVTGTAEQLSRFAGDLGSQYRVSADEDDYTVAHSVTFSIIDTNGEFRGRFWPGFELANLVENFIDKLSEDRVST